MKAPLLVLVPSRGRPGNVARLLNGIAETSAGQCDVVVLVDEDDPTRPDYLEAVQDVGFAWLEAGPPTGGGGMTGPLNRGALAYAGSYRALGFMGDDHLPRTASWDKQIMAALREQGAAAIVYGDDLFQRANLPTAVFMGSCIVDALGWMAPPALRHFYLDNYWMQLGVKLGRLRYLPSVVIEHLHPAAFGKAPHDAEYGRTGPMMALDQGPWEAYVQGGGIDADAARVRANCIPAGGRP